MAPKMNPLGPTGEAVRANVARHRKRLNLTYAELSRRLDSINRQIPVLGLSRIEAGERRVDADDLLALAVALEVSPTTLLMPDAARRDDPVSATGIEGPAQDILGWLSLEVPIEHVGKTEDQRDVRDGMKFIADALPRWTTEGMKFGQVPGTGHREYTAELFQKMLRDLRAGDPDAPIEG
ncbi:helix-turn-helix domain-containing protein [Nocardia sp. CNY236]|uniref:helix-turn-helix domain-containing protein n=1 Tax=Nocardia sp. CNY236 TaxID=1169152 RepID=UPI00042462F2|nr:helix-turn-helix transcriptional regulator [Nocardia sp. CNY236]